MPKVRANRKASDYDIIRLDSVGLSLATIGKMLGCHPTSITQRLHHLGIDPSDTRHSFMEQVLTDLPESTRDWLADTLEATPGLTIKAFVGDLLRQAHKQDKSP